MIKIFNILNKTFCLLLMIHLLAVGVCDNYLSKLINKTSIGQVIDFEEDTTKDSKVKNVEFDNIDDEYSVNSLNNGNHLNAYCLQKNLPKISFQYLQIALPQSIDKILIPPPRW